MIVVHYPTAFKKLHKYIEGYNDSQESHGSKLKSGVILTAKEIIRIYGISLIKADAIKRVDPQDPPSLKTNNVQLSKLVQCSSRSIQRHIKKLIEAGIISRKIWHGSNSGYELWINSEILGIAKKESELEAKVKLDQALEKARENERKVHFEESTTTNCPHTYSGYTSNNNIVIEVDNPFGSAQKAIQDTQQDTSQELTGNNSERSSPSLTGEIDSSGYTSGNSTGYTGENEAKILNELEKTGEKEGNRAKKDPIDEDDPARTSSLNLYASMLWLLASKVLYRDKDLTDRQIQRAKNLIRKLYEPVKTNDLNRIHGIYCTRISLASKYVRKDPENRFVPLPDHYFNTNNPKGFCGTKRWYNAYQVRKKEVQLELILRAQVRKYLNNLKKDVSRPQLDVFRECEQRLGKLGDPSIVDRFYAEILENQGYDQLTTNQ